MQFVTALTQHDQLRLTGRRGAVHRHAAFNDNQRRAPAFGLIERQMATLAQREIPHVQR